MEFDHEKKIATREGLILKIKQELADESISQYEEQHELECGWSEALDFAWPRSKVAVRITDGSKEYFSHQMYWYNGSKIKGWIVLQYTPELASEDGLVVRQVREALASRIEA